MKLVLRNVLQSDAIFSSTLQLQWR